MSISGGSSPLGGGGVKRGLDQLNDSEEGEESKRKKSEERSTQIFIDKVQVVDDIYRTNELHLDRRDLKRLFPQDVDDEGPLYARVANNVYKVCTDIWSWRYKLPLTPLQFSTVSSFRDAKVLVSSCRSCELPQSSARQVVFKIKREGNGDFKSAYKLSELRKAATSFLSGHYLRTNQTLYFFDDDGDRFKITLSESVLDEGESSRLIYIDRNTQIDFESTYSVNIVNDSVMEEYQWLRFDVFCEKLKGAKKLYSPAIIKEDRLIHFIRRKFQENIISKLDEETFNYDNKWSVTVSVNEGDQEVFPPMYSESEEELIEIDYPTARTFGERTQVKFSHNSAVLIEKEGGVEVQECQVEIVKASNRISRGEEYEKKDWVSVEAIQRMIRGNHSDFLCDQRIGFSFSTGYYELVFKHAQLPKGLDETLPLGYARPWKISHDTTIRVTTARGVTVKLVSNDRPLPANKVVFELSQMRGARGLFSSMMGDEGQEATLLEHSDLLAAFQRLELKECYKGQSLMIEVRGEFYTLKLSEIESETLEPRSYFEQLYLIKEDTSIEFSVANQKQLTLRQPVEEEIEKDPLTKLRDLGLGGMKEQIGRLVRQIFLSRGHLREIALKRKVAPVRGVLLYGPPGTGKTTLARHIGGLLGSTLKNGRLTMMSGSEIFNKWLGESEKKVRELFKPAREDFEKAKRQGEEAPLHVIVIDEIDAMLPQRSSDSHRAGNSVTAQFLGEMDGLNQLPNVLVFGITNHLESLDSAVRRPGRLGVHLEIGLPDLEGRKEILLIHAYHLIKAGAVAEDVNFDELARRTNKKSGADLESIVIQAHDRALERLQAMEETDHKVLATCKEGKVTMADFESILKGKSDEELPESIRHIYM